jgi:hypothetical protein
VFFFCTPRKQTIEQKEACVALMLHFLYTFLFCFIVFFSCVSICFREKSQLATAKLEWVKIQKLLNLGLDPMLDEDMQDGDENDEDVDDEDENEDEEEDEDEENEDESRLKKHLSQEKVQTQNAAQSTQPQTPKQLRDEKRRRETRRRIRRLKKQIDETLIQSEYEKNKQKYIEEEQRREQEKANVRSFFSFSFSFQVHRARCFSMCACHAIWFSFLLLSQWTCGHAAHERLLSIARAVGERGEEGLSSACGGSRHFPYACTHSLSRARFPSPTRIRFRIMASFGWTRFPFCFVHAFLSVFITRVPSLSLLLAQVRFGVFSSCTAMISRPSCLPSTMMQTH